MTKNLILAALLLTLASCGEKVPDKPTFQIGKVNFTYGLLKGFCPASEDWKRAFASIEAQNADKAVLGQLVDCVENARYANSPNYILIAIYSDPARQVLSRDDQRRDFKPRMDNQAFLTLLHSDKAFSELQRLAAKSPDKPLGESGNAFPEVSDEHCLYSGGRYGELPLTPETSGTVVNCLASVGGRQIMIMYNGDGKQDLLAMARKVGALAGSIAVHEN